MLNLEYYHGLTSMGARAENDIVEAMQMGI